MSAANGNRDLENLLDFVRRNRGFDFTAYKRASLERRIAKRVHDMGLKTFADYLDHLQAQPEEFVALLNTILINVTGFFRDPEHWQYLAAEIIPRLLAGKRTDEPIRVWSPGCASGEEVYTAAMLLAEALGEEQFRQRVKLYGTDVDEEALSLARQAAYSAKRTQDVPPALREKYFERAEGSYLFRKDLRRAAIFGRHDLLQDPPISRVDLLICRNTLMYFNAEAQTRILSRLHFALGDNGYLFLGRAEMLLTRAHLFLPVDAKHRVFAKVAAVRQYERLSALENGRISAEAAAPARSAQDLRDLAYDSSPVAQLIVDGGGALVAANDRARALFGLSLADVGRPLRDLEVSYRPVDLRSLLDSAYLHNRPVGQVGAEWRRAGGDTYFLDVQVVPLAPRAGQEGPNGAGITFLDVTRLKQLQEDSQRARQELETYAEELHSANEELETTNEELQSTNEELETTNEELQSANEEMETMNGELQSTNEEMGTVNQELQQLATELDRANTFRTAILAGIGIGVAVLDRELRLQVWNRKAADLWGLREEEVNGQHFFNLDIGLPVDQLKQRIRACLAGEVEPEGVVLDAVDRRGRNVRCEVSCAPLAGTGKDVQSVIVLMQDLEGRAEHRQDRYE